MKQHNHRITPIALQNAMYKVYTAIIADFIMEHCERNGIVTEEQAAGKRGSWGCTDQLLINKKMYEEVVSNRRNLVTVWLDYKKAFDSMPHSWILESLMLKWRTQARLNGEKENIETDFIKYLRGILQGDTLSLILFVLAVNPLSFLLSKYEGYSIGKTKRTKNISHLFFVDDLKLYALNLKRMIEMLKMVMQFSEDVGMNFGVNKCVYQCIERGKRKEQSQPLEVNSLIIKEVEEGDTYKYLGVDESIGINGPLNKDRVVKEYKARVKKIWNSELNGNNKAITHNSFSVPIITPTVGILNRTKKEISDLDIAMRKIMNMAGAFHTAGDVDRLYVKWKNGGRGLRSIEDTYEIRTVGLKKHLDEVACKHSLLELVEKHEKDKIGRLGEEFLKRRKEFQESSNVKQRTKNNMRRIGKEKLPMGIWQRN